jgi:hypothetical protein
LYPSKTFREAQKHSLGLYFLLPKPSGLCKDQLKQLRAECHKKTGIIIIMNYYSEFVAVAVVCSTMKQYSVTVKILDR